MCYPSLLLIDHHDLPLIVKQQKFDDIVGQCPSRCVEIQDCKEQNLSKVLLPLHEQFSTRHACSSDEISNPALFADT